MEYSSDTDKQAYSPTSQWIEMLAGPLIWTVHFLTVYFLVEFACGLGFLGSLVFGVRALVWVIVIATLIALALLGYAAIRAYRHWKEVRSDREVNDEAMHETAEVMPLLWGRSEFMTLAGWALSLFFGPVILLTAIPPLLLRTCTWT